MHKLKHISFSRIKLFEENPDQYRERYIEGLNSPSNSAMIFGSAVHCYVLEREEFNDRFIFENPSIKKEDIIQDIMHLAPRVDDANQIIYKQRKLEQEKAEKLKRIKNTIKGLIVMDGKYQFLKKSEYEIIKIVAERINSLKFKGIAFKDVVDSDKSMKEYHIEGEINETPATGFIDLLYKDKREDGIKYYAFDLKTFRQGGMNVIKETMSRYKYYYQAHFYQDLLRNKDININEFYFIFIDKSKWHPVLVRYDFRYRGGYENWRDTNIINLKKCYREQNWDIKNHENGSNILEV